MGGGTGGAFLLGLSNSLQRAQEQKTQNEYKKALIDQSKLQTKMLENKLQLADQEQGMMAAYLRTKGIELPQRPPAQLAQTQPQPQQSLLGRLFNPQPQAPVQQVAAQAPLPQMIAQGQAQGQIPGQTPPNSAFMEDVMGKKMFDLPPWREKFEAEQGAKKGRVNKYLDMGVGFLPMTEDNKVMGPMIPKAMKYDWKEGQPIPGGPTMNIPIPEYPGMGSGQGGPQPFVKEQPKGETPESAGKSQAIIGGLQDGIKFLEVIKNPDTGEINQKTIAGMTAPLMGNIGGLPGTQSREGLSLFRNAVDAIVRQRTGAQIRADEWPYYNSIYLPDYKDSPQLQKSKTERLNRDLAGALMQTDPNQTKLDRSMSVTPKGKGLGPTPQVGIPSGYQYGGTKNGKPFYVNPGATPDKRYWVP